MTNAGVIVARPAVPARQFQAQSYVALAVIVGIPVLSILTGQAGLLRVAFPPLCVAVGALLLWRSKPLYLGFVLWLWFLTPFLRRMADFQGGWSVTSAVLLAPYITAALSGLTLLRSVGRLWDRKYLPFISAFVAIAYGLFIGLIRFPLFNVLQALVNWLVPVVFGVFVYENRRLYPEFRRVIERSFLFGVLLTGAYGIYQFFELPDWDKSWMLNVQLNSFGGVEPMKIRVFSTMNAPIIFGTLMACGLLLIFNMRGKLRMFAAACGFLGMILTMSRSSWMSLLAGALFLAVRMGMRQRTRLAVAVFGCFVFLSALTAIPAIHDLVMQRLQTFSDPNHDVSFSARLEGHQEALRQIGQEPFGEGLGSTDTMHNTEGDDDIIGPHDSTPLEFLYSLGWIGTLIYGMGLSALGIQLMRTRSKDPFVLSSKAVLIGFLAQCLLNSVMLGVLGFLVWTFAAMTLAEAENAETAEEGAAQLQRSKVHYAAA
jgi:hypothetical protein